MGSNFHKISIFFRKTKMFLGLQGGFASDTEDR